MCFPSPVQDRPQQLVTLTLGCATPFSALLGHPHTSNMNIKINEQNTDQREAESENKSWPFKALETRVVDTGITWLWRDTRVPVVKYNPAPPCQNEKNGGVTKPL